MFEKTLNYFLQLKYSMQMSFELSCTAEDIYADWILLNNWSVFAEFFHPLQSLAVSSLR